MIHVPRSHIPEPDFWDAPEFRDFLSEWTAFHGEKKGTRGTQRRSPGGAQLDRFRELALPPLLTAFGGKCAYTEQKITEKDATVVFHRPEADAIGMDGEVSPEHYWWMIGDWTNWYPASRAVALAKSTVFPVIGPRSMPPSRRADRSISAIEWMEHHRDRGLLLDPGRDHPAWYLDFQLDGSVHPLRHPSPATRSLADNHSRGEVTIKILDLNNRRLREGRETAVTKAQELWVHAERPADSRVEFAAAARQAAAQELLIMAHHLSKDKLKSLIRNLAEELAAVVAVEGVPWPQDSIPLPLEHWAPVRKVITREWPELDDDAWKRMIAGGTGDGRRDALESFSIDAEAPAESPPAVWTTGLGTKRGATLGASDLESERVVERTARIAEIKIRNFKAIEELDLELATDGVELLPPYGSDEETLHGVNWTALLGENGSGKSCCLQAIGLALAGDTLDDLIDKGEIEWRKVLRRGADDGRVFLRFTGDTILDLRFDAEKHWWDGGAPRVAAFVRGYGATRLLESKAPGKGTGDGTIVRLANLFNPKAPVIDAERWLLDLEDDGDFHVAALALGGFLGSEEGAGIEDETKATAEPFITRDLERREVLAGGEPLSYASDGYRATVALVCDIMAGLGVGLSDMRNATGIVLLDEIGAHLHPRWKMEVTSRLRREFPQLQFLVSTHEPLCLRGLFEHEVIRVRKTRPERAPGAPAVAGRVSFEVIERSPSDYRVDQLLTSEFFGLDTTIDPDLDRRFQAYYRLLAKTPEEREAAHPRDPSRTLEDEMLRLRAELKRLTRPVLGFTRRDQLVYEAIDQFLVAEADSPVEGRQERRQNILERIKDLWTPPDVLRRMNRET